VAVTAQTRLDAGKLRAWPWAINREGKGYWFGSREEALAFAKASVMAGRPSFDVGCFQINYYWHGKNFASLEAMFDPDVGAAYASQFLKSLYAERGDWSLAAGAYHSQTPERAGVYRARFDRIMAGLTGRPLAVVAAAEPERVDAAPAAPKKSRTRMSKGPKIITVPKRVPVPSQEAWAGDAGLGARTMQAALVSNRRKVPPFGLGGGGPGVTGDQWIERAMGEVDKLEGRCRAELGAGDVFAVQTPSGGGFGHAEVLHRHRDAVHRHCCRR